RSGNYDFSYVDGSLTLTNAHLTVTADDKSREYGNANPAFPHVTLFPYTTLYRSDLTTAPSCTSAATATSPVPGPYAITCSGGASVSCDYGYVDGTLTLTKAHLTVTADDKSREYGNANPAFTHVTSGFKNGEHESDLTTAPSCTSAATATSPVPGPYAITCSGGASGNYDFSYVDGSLTLTKAQLDVTPDGKTKVYGDVNPALTASFSGFKNSETLASSDVTGTPSVSTTAGPSSDAGNYLITAAAGTLSSGNYNFM